jgi:hypothetical protein
MSLPHIFISHAGADGPTATTLAEHLRNAGHQTKIDTLDLTLGGNTITFMNEGIGQAHTVVILLSQNSKKAVWQLAEIDAAIWNEIAQAGGQCIVVRLDDAPVPPLLGPKVYGKLDPNNPDSLEKLIGAICKVALAEPNASSVIADALRPASKNPFRFLRAEFFEDRPDLHAKTFAPPDALKVGALEEIKPCFLEGSRGTGKSMLLLSLRARNFRLRHRESSEMSRIFGFYLKLSRGAICNVGVIPGAELDTLAVPGPAMAQINDVAAQEIVIQLIESLFSEVTYCIVHERLIECERTAEKALAEAADALIFDAAATRVATLDELLDKLGEAHKRIADFIRRRFIYGEQPTVPFGTFDLDQIKRVVKLVRRHIPALKETMFVALLDEYENLFPYQQRIVNGLVKLGPPNLSVKIAKKLGGGDTSGTTAGQELQETHDYTRLRLVYDVEDTDQRRAYRELLEHIVRNIFRSENLGSVDVHRLLPVDDSLEVPEEKLKAEVVKLAKVTPEQFAAWPEEQRQEKWVYYRETAIYRALLAKRRRADKRFCGFNELAFMSSGVIRYFQEILGVTYHLTFGAAPPRTRDLILPPEKQSQAVHFVSQHNLTTLSRNVERYGEDLKYFLLDLGDCLRHKLLKHNSEPEAARLTIEDPERLDDEEMAVLKCMLVVGVREGIFQTKEGLPAFKPKHSSDPQPAEFNISRIYAPVLEISPRLRWRTPVDCRALLGLLQKGKRAQAMQKLKAEIVKKRKPAARPQGQLPFSKPDKT